MCWGLSEYRCVCIMYIVDQHGNNSSAISSSVTLRVAIGDKVYIHNNGNEGYATLIVSADDYSLTATKRFLLSSPCSN